jgi:hypothetical protein
MKKQYTRPTIVKVELNQEQAILGTCAIGITNPKTPALPNLCSITPDCKNYKSGDSGATS